MAKRVLLGKPADDDYGLYVSKSGSDVIDGSGNLTTDTNLMFDSRVGIGALNLKFHGQGLLGIPGNNLNTATNLNTSDTSATITHNAGDTITKVNDNTYNFTTGTTASSTLKGGGGLASAGPVTVTA